MSFMIFCQRSTVFFTRAQQALSYHTNKGKEVVNLKFAVLTEPSSTGNLCQPSPRLETIEHHGAYISR